MHNLLLSLWLAAALPTSAAVEPSVDGGASATSVPTVPPPVPVGPLPTIPPSAAVGHPERRVPRRVLVLMQLAAPDVAAAISANLKSQSADEVPEARIRAGLRQQFRTQPAWATAEELRRRGLDAEQNLDLDAAIASLSQARDALIRLGGSGTDPGGLAQVRLELAQCEDEKGDLIAAQAELRHWAELGTAPLDPKIYPPAFVALARQAQADAAPLPGALPLAAIWASGAVDEVVMVGSAGLPGAEDAVLLHYPQGHLRPDRVTSVTRVGPVAEQQAGVRLAVSGILGAGGASQVGPSNAPSEAAPTNATPSNDVNNPIYVSAGFILPYEDAFSRYGVSSFGYGLSLAGRVGLSFGEVGGRIDLIGGSFGIIQLAPTVRWTWHKGHVLFDLEPALFLQIRNGCTLGSEACGEVVSPTSVLFGVELGTGIGYQLSDSWSVEEQFTVGAILGANFDLNAPYRFGTHLTYTF